MPKISLITPSFNQDKYLEECIDSILSQNYPNLEYIIMDGGSTDRSVDIIKKYERYLTYWQSRPDKGQYWAINEGFKKSTGEVMCWLNSDDKYHPLALFNVASLFTELPHIQWITGQPTVLGKHGDIISIVPLPKWSRRRYLFYDHDSLHIQQESTFWRRSLWEKAGAYLDVSLNYAGDFELWSRFFRFEDLYSVDLLLGGFRLHENQKTATFMEEYRQESYQVRDREVKIFNQQNQPLQPAPEPIKRQNKATIKAKELNREGNQRCAAGNIHSAATYFEKAVELDPRNANTYSNLGVTYYKLGKTKESIHQLKKGLLIDPRNKDLALNAGEIFKALGRHDIARDHYLTILSRDPEDISVTEAWSKLADNESDKKIRELIKAKPDNYVVSAIVSTYKSGDFIGECLDNLESQTISDKLEIVVVDAASPENERDTVIAFQKRFTNITYIRTNAKIGVYAAWNIAVKYSSGKYCISTSTNDVLRKDACELLAHTLDQNQEYALVYGDTYLTAIPHETFANNTHYDTYQWPPYSFEKLLRTCMVGPHPMWRKSIHREIGYFDEKYIAIGDQEFWLRTGEKYNLLHIPEFTGVQWIAPESLSKNGITPELEIKQIHTLYQKRNDRLKKEKPAKCSIIIPVFNQLEYTKMCLKAIKETTPSKLYKLIIVDNASTDGTRQFLESYSDKAKIIINENNLGFAKACNQGANASSADYLIFLNNDTVPKEKWLEEILETAEKDKDIGIVGSKLLFPDGTIQHAGVVIAKGGLGYHIYRGLPGDAPCANKERDFSVVTGACLMVRSDLFNEVGGFDERYINGCEDTDLCLNVLKKGKRVVYNPRSILIHFEGKSEHREIRMDYNKRLFKEKWPNIEQDDLKYLKEDGMKLRVSSNGNFEFEPIEITQTPKISIIVVTYNSLKDIQSCIQSIQTKTTTPYEVVIVDNNSSDGTEKYLKTLKNIKLILNTENRGFSAATNQGINISTGDYIVLLNPDTIVTKNWIQRMIAHFDKGVGAVGPISNYVAGLQKVQHYIQFDRNKPLNIDILAEQCFTKNRGHNAETKLLIGFCLMTKRDIMEKVGLLDEDLFLGSDDLEYCHRLQRQGYKLLVATDTFIYHKGQASFQTQPSEQMKRLTQESQDALHSKLEKIYGKKNVPSAMDLWGINWFKPTQLKEEQTTQKQVSIIMLTYNQLEYTKKCIESIFKYTEMPFELIVIDNGSTDETINYLANIEKNATSTADIKIIKNKKNLGFAAGNNRGLSRAKGKYIVLINNDVVVTPSWLEKMICCAKKHPQIGIVGPMTNYVPGPQLVKDIKYDPVSLSELNHFARDYAIEHSQDLKPVLRVVGFCMLIKKTVIEKIGGLDERYGLGNFEDDDFSIRAKLAGFQSWIAGNCFVHHFGSRTFKGAGIDYHKSLQENWELFKKKWEIPQTLPYGSYNLSHIGRQNFVPQKDHFPIVTEEEIKKLTTIEKIYQTAKTLETQNDTDEALCCYRKIAELQSSSDSYYNLGIKLYENGNLDEAIASFESATNLNPKDTDAYYNLGLALCARKNYKESIIYFQKARLNGDNSAHTCHCMGIAFQALRQYSEATLFCRKALALDPGHIQAHLTLGSNLKFLGETEKAIACYQELTKIAPDNTEALRNLAELYRKQKDSDSALAYYKRIIAIEPDNFEAYKQSGIILNNQGYIEPASKHFEKALALKYDPGLAVRAALSLPVIDNSPESIRVHRKQLQDKLEELTDNGVTLQDPYKEVGMTSFLLAYHNLNDKSLQQKIADFYLNACPSLGWTAPHCKNAKKTRGKIKIGFISTFFYSHTISLLFFGIIEKISRKDFHVTIFRFTGNEDSLTSTIEQVADETVILPYELALARKKIAEKTPDILFYLDIGMEPMTYYLAFSRLAPVQCFDIGHPVTSGIPNLDYFISCDEAETEVSEQHYIEKLVRLKTIGYYYYPPKTPDSAKQREDFKLPLDAKLYVCPQSLFKFHPDFDHLLAGILNQDPNGVLVLIEGREESWSRLLLKRLSQKLSDDIKRVIVLPRMSAHDFLSLCMLADAILDTPGFSGGKTSLDCFALSLPIVTMASPYARGRLTIAQYKLMGIDDCIAENELNYIELAIKLANNKTWKKEISEKIKRKSHVLFKNIESVKELERFFIRAYARITGSSDETPIVLPDNHHRD